MAYEDLTQEELILLAAEYVGTGQEIPVDLSGALGPHLTGEILTPWKNRNAELQQAG